MQGNAGRSPRTVEIREAANALKSTKVSVATIR
jgi:hypothetical protein